MAVFVENYPHRTGEHCASTALRNILRFHDCTLSEGMIVGLASGLGFFYIRSDATSPSRMFHGRTISLEQDFCRNTGIDFEERSVEDDDEAWREVRERVDSGLPVMVSTDTFYLGYQNTTSHFPGHRAVVVGYDEATRTIYIADREFDEYQQCSYDELRSSRNAPDYPVSCHNQYGDFKSEVGLGVPLADAIRSALIHNAETLLEAPGMQFAPAAISGIDGMRTLAEDFHTWKDLADWSWAARFGYQVVIKRGAGGSFFRSLYGDFLDEAAAVIPVLGEREFGTRMHGIAADWRDFAMVLKEQSERETCRPGLFVEAGRRMADLATKEESFFREIRQIEALTHDG